MAKAWPGEGRSPGLFQGVESAQGEPEGRFHSLAYLIDGAALERADHRQRVHAAGGVDGITKEAYGPNRKATLQDLPVRLKDKRYRHQPIRRVHLPQGEGKTRPSGLSACADTLVQDAVREVLEAGYEQDFLDGSQGLRPGRKAHGAVRSLKRIVEQGEGRGIVEADIGSFFDRLDRTTWKERLEVRVADGSLLRRIGTGLHGGGLDGEALYEPEWGTVQGSVRSPR